MTQQQFVLALIFTACQCLGANCQTTDSVGDSRLPTGRTIQPAGKLVSFYGRPVDLAIHESTLFAKNHKELKAFDIESMQEIATAPIPGGASLYGIGCDPQGRIFVTNTKNDLHIFELKDSKLSLSKSITLAKDCFPCGLTLNNEGSTAYVCLSKKNTLAIVDLESENVTQIPVGVAPFDCYRRGSQLIVTNLGGRQALLADKTAPSAGTKTVIDERGIASTGSISVIDLETQKVAQTLKSGLQPSVVDGDGRSAVVCNSNDDTVTIVHNGETSSLNIKPDDSLPFGSMPSCIRVLEDKVLITLAGNNAIAVYNRTPKNEWSLAGHVPTAWYPGSLAINERYLFVGSIKGIGARAERRPTEKGRNSHDHQGSIQRIALADLDDEAKLAQWSKQVSTNARLPQILRNQLLDKSNAESDPQPIPAKLGQPSIFKHILYVIKENRTFDQVFGDYKDARSDSRLCIFPREKTPNHHALADRFGILDNYYCNGVLSADGHSWATEGNVTPYLERAFGGFSRSYTFGDDPITYSSSGFIWDQILAAGLSFRNYGEFDYAKPPEGLGYHEIFKKFNDGEHVKFGNNIGVERLRKYSCLDYPGWNMEIPDVLRMDRFLKEFRDFEKNDSLPNFCILYLPEDHLGARDVTSDAHMADNDLALGRLVEAVSKSKFWKDTVIFVNEDDPQNGFDHIDGHRSICLVISPYSRKGINHHFYNQTSVLRTMLHIFGLPPMNQQDASAPLMSECFQNEPDYSPYVAITPKTPLDQKPNAQSTWSPAERKWRQVLATVPIHRTGIKTEQDEDNLNRFIWHESKGWLTPYPEHLAGAHAKGLKRLGLSLNPNVVDD